MNPLIVFLIMLAVAGWIGWRVGVHSARVGWSHLKAMSIACSLSLAVNGCIYWIWTLCSK